ncbi:MAG: hypothetical protein H0T05_02450 [Acidobacteria bacterium]|nr:hypothetical protein [Acidobacteriota bacterium]MBA3887045.1 hypothetical protein [Acidobacteriota bacterium]
MTDPSDYAREIERYLCQKNEGHLVRIVGPAFEQVCGWAVQGVPLKVAFRGIDRCCQRYYAKGPRRRPVRIEFCEADILEQFDDWRRAVGVTVAAGAGEVPEEPKARKTPLASHIERVVARLVSVRGRGPHPGGLDEVVDGVVRELEGLTDEARNARGDRRTALFDRLEGLDASLIEAARKAVDEPTTASLRAEADAELAPFGARLPPDARSQAVAAAFDRLVRDFLGLPRVRYEQ